MSPPSPLFLCVDCGGTKTAAVICDADGAILGRGTAGPSNIAYLPVPAFLRAVTDAILRALAAAQHPFGSLSPSSTDNGVLSPFPSAPFERVWFGISGADSPSAIGAVTPSLAALLHLPLDPASPTGTSTRLAVANDTHLLAAPVHDFPKDGDGRVTHVVSVIAGTGSIAVSFARGGGRGEGAELTELGRVGGWGWILGDEGGGYDVGRETLRQILAAADHDQILSAHAASSSSSTTTTTTTSESDTAIKSLYPSPFTSSVLARFGVSAGGGALDVFGGVYAPDPPPSPPVNVSSPTGTGTDTDTDTGTGTGANTDKDSEDALAAYLTMPREKRISSLPPLVFAAAFPPTSSKAEADPLALNILRTCAAKLGAQAGALFGLTSPSTHAHMQYLPSSVSSSSSSSTLAPGTEVSSTPAPILDPAHTLLTFGGSLAGVPAYRAMIVADLAARFKPHNHNRTTATSTPSATSDADALFPPDRVVFVDDAAAAGARGLASAWRRENTAAAGGSTSRV